MLVVLKVEFGHGQEEEDPLHKNSGRKEAGEGRTVSTNPVHKAESLVG